MGSEDYIECKKALGLRVSRLRTGLGLSQREFAATAGMDRMYLSKIEAGTTNPSLESIAKIAEGLGVDLADMFRE